MSTGTVTVLPGWWGKLPGAGDFSHRRLDEAARARLDGWLQAELAAMRARHPGWQAAYLKAPLWHFALGAGLLSEHPWLGILMPSVDRVGRYFPLVIAQPLEQVADAGRDAAAWWQLAAEAALHSLAQDHGPDGLEAALTARFAHSESQVKTGTPAPPASPGHSQWRNAVAGTAALTVDGWPRGAHFDLLFDLAGLPAAMEPDA